MDKKNLPIGTVVQLENKTRKLMITGYKSKKIDDDRVYDYNGILFPEGLMENIYGLFDASDIAEIFYEGYKDDKYKEYIKKIDGITVAGISHYEKDGKKPDSRGRRRVPQAPKHPKSKAEMLAEYGVTTKSTMANGEAIDEF